VEGGRDELKNDLAEALMNKGLALEQLEHWAETFKCYNEAIALWEAAVQGGQAHLLTSLLRAIRCRLKAHINLQSWEAVAEGIQQALVYLSAGLEQPSPSENLRYDRLMLFIVLLPYLSDEAKAQLISALGEDAEVLELLD